MDKLEPVMLFQTALESPCGISLKTTNYRAAQQLRRQLYAARESLRKKGQHEADQLSFVAQSNGELWLVVRLPIKSELKAILSIRPLGKDEIPADLKARGKSKLGIFSPLFHATSDEY